MAGIILLKILARQGLQNKGGRGCRYSMYARVVIRDLRDLVQIVPILELSNWGDGNLVGGDLVRVEAVEKTGTYMVT